MPSEPRRRRFIPLDYAQLAVIAIAALLGVIVDRVELSAGEAPPSLVVPAKDVAMQVAVILPDSVKLEPDGAARLVEIGCPDVRLPAQVVNSMAEDGCTGRAGGCLLAVIPPRSGATGQRRFSLVPKLELGNEADAAAGDSKSGFYFKPISDASLSVCEGDKPVFAYNHGAIVKDDIPEKESRRSRACYVHPVWGLSGEIITDDFPRDHYHHHGIFWAWPYVGYDGREYDLWMYRNIQPRFVRWIVQESGPLGAVLAVSVHVYLA